VKNPDLRRIAIHEAGHFVVANMMGLGEMIEVTVTATHGHVKRKLGPMDVLLQAELRGDPLETVLVADEDTAKDIANYREGRHGYINQIVIESLAGVAAATELGGGDGTIGKTDYFKARNAAALMMPEAEIGDFLTRRMNEVRALCRIQLRHPILAVAERFMARPTLAAADLLAIWQEVNPGQ
jgi:hypothetical protein